MVIEKSPGCQLMSSLVTPQALKFTENLFSHIHLLHVTAIFLEGEMSCDKPLSEPMMVSLPTHICVTRPRWVNSSLSGQIGRYFEDDIFKCIIVNEELYCY